MKKPQKPLAPVLIGTCNRFSHFKALVESLKACYWVAETEIYIAIDAPYADEVLKVNQEIKAYSKTIIGFAKLHIMERPYNLGPTENFNQAMDEIFQHHETLILLEDDNIVAKNFLVYMNKALVAFENDTLCFAICGYNFPSELIEEYSITDVYAAPYQSAWGVGYWKDKYYHPQLTAGERPHSFLLNPIQLLRVYLNNPPLFPAYIGSFLAGTLYADQQLSLNCLKKRQYCIYPRNTMVINNGFDGSGMHCGKSTVLYHNEFELQEKVDFLFPNIRNIDREYIKINYIWFKDSNYIKWYMWLYSYLIFIVSYIIGRKKTIQLRDLLKKVLYKN